MVIILLSNFSKETTMTNKYIEETKALLEKHKAKWKASEKQCTDCKYYVENYKDDFTLRFYGYGEVKYRPACRWGNTYAYVEHNPAALCIHYERLQNNE